MGKGSYTIHDLPLQDRPRERLQQVGEANLSQQELLAIIIEKGGRGENALQLSQRLIVEFGSLAKLKNATFQQLISIKGIGPATACKLKAAFQIGKLGSQKSFQAEKRVRSANDVFDLIKNEIGDKNKEYFLLICLDARNRITAKEIVSIGTLNSSLSHPREIFKSAIDHQACYLILAHNHPSGDVQPSRSDLKLTEKLIAVSQLVNIPIIDHLIVSSTDYFSWKENNLI